MNIKKIGIYLTLSTMIVSLAMTADNKPTGNKAIDPSNMDLSIKPGDDFFHYANGTWLKNNPIPAQYARYGNFEKLMETNLSQLKGIMEDAAGDKKAVKGTNRQKIGDFYFSGMDTLKIEKEGIEPLRGELTKIENIKSSDDIVSVLAHLNTIGIYPIFAFYPDQDKSNSKIVIANTFQGELGLPERDYYVENDEDTKLIREKYVVHITNMFKLMGKDEKTAKTVAESILKLETELATVSKSMNDLRDPIKNFNRMTTADLQKMTPDFNWATYYKAIGINDPSIVSVGQIEYTKAWGDMLKKVDINSWKNLLTWNLISSMSPYLSKAFVEESFNFKGKVLTGKTKMQERWKKVLNTTSESLGEAVGQLYVEKYFPAKAKDRMLGIVNNLKDALAERIQKLDWMTDATKGKALEKLKVMNVKIGYPDKWKDYSNLDIDRSSYVGNIMKANTFSFRFDMNKINKPVDRSEWGMTPQTINAYYSPTMNEIVFPAAILQEPFFFMDADDAVNYAAIGTIIGHEMTHGFDDQGCKYDKEGNLNDWWTPADIAKYKEKAKNIIDQFNNFKVLDSLHVNGEMTLGENIADLGGITVSHVAFLKANKETSKIEGFTPEQRFFLSYAQVWRTNIREQQEKMNLKTDVHSPAIARVNCMIYNVPEFYKAFNIEATAKRYIAPEKRAGVW